MSFSSWCKYIYILLYLRYSGTTSLKLYLSFKTSTKTPRYIVFSPAESTATTPTTNGAASITRSTSSSSDVSTDLAKLSHKIHCLPQELHRIFDVSAVTTAKSAPTASSYPDMNAYTPVTPVASDTGAVATVPPPMTQKQCSNLSYTISVWPFPLSPLLCLMNLTQFTSNYS